MKLQKFIPKPLIIFIEGLMDARISYYASSLSWSTLFSIIPLLVIVIAILTSMPIFNTIYNDIHTLLFRNLLPTNSEIIMGYIDEFIANSGKLGLIGISYVTIATIMFFKDYDHIVNDIFETPKRTVWQAAKNYTLMVIIVPLMLGSSFYLSSQIQNILNQNVATSSIHLYQFLPYLMIWSTFYLAYQLSAHTDVSRASALLSSFVASLLWYGAKSGFVFYVSQNKTYASIYGGISVLLFFFLWIYISWMLFLYGLRFCYMLDKTKKEKSIEDSQREQENKKQQTPHGSQ